MKRIYLSMRNLVRKELKNFHPASGFRRIRRNRLRLHSSRALAQSSVDYAALFAQVLDRLQENHPAHPRVFPVKLCSAM